MPTYINTYTCMDCYLHTYVHTYICDAYTHNDA